MDANTTQAAREPLASVVGGGAVSAQLEQLAQQVKAPATVAGAGLDGTPAWQQKIWIGCGLGLLSIICLLCFFGGYTISTMVDLLKVNDQDRLFQFAGMNMISHGLLRILAILIGGTIGFAGLAVSFFAHQRAMVLDAAVGLAEQHNVKLALAAYSPGIFALLVGAVIINCGVFARAQLDYEPARAGAREDVLGAVMRPLPPLEEALKQGAQHGQQDPKPGR